MSASKETMAAVSSVSNFDILQDDHSILKLPDKGFRTATNSPFNLGISSGLGVFPYLPSKLYMFVFGLYLAPNNITKRIVEIADIPGSFSLTFPTGSFLYIYWPDSVTLAAVVPDNDSWLISGNQAVYTVKKDSVKEFQFTFSLRET